MIVYHHKYQNICLDFGITPEGPQWLSVKVLPSDRGVASLSLTGIIVLCL